MKSQGDGASDGLEPPGVTGHRDTEQRQSLFPVRIACLARNNKAKLERKGLGGRARARGPLRERQVSGGTVDGGLALRDQFRACHSRYWRSRIDGLGPGHPRVAGSWACDGRLFVRSRYLESQLRPIIPLPADMLKITLYTCQLLVWGAFRDYFVCVRRLAAAFFDVFVDWRGRAV